MPCGFKCPFAERRPCGGFLLCRILMEDGVNYNERKNAMTVLCAFQQQCQKTGRMENTNSAKACYKHNIPAHDPKRAETHSLQIPGSPPRPPKKPKDPEPPIPDPGTIPIDIPPVDPEPWGEPIPGEEPIPVVDPVPADPEIPPSPSDDSGNSGGHEDWNPPVGEDTNPPEDPVLPDPEEVTEELEDMGVPVEEPEPEPEPEPVPTRTGRKKTT